MVSHMQLNGSLKTNVEEAFCIQCILHELWVMPLNIDIICLEKEKTTIDVALKNGRVDAWVLKPHNCLLEDGEGRESGDRYWKREGELYYKGFFTFFLRINSKLRVAWVWEGNIFRVELISN